MLNVLALLGQQEALEIKVSELVRQNETFALEGLGSKALKNPKAQNSPKAFFDRVFGPKSLKI